MTNIVKPHGKTEAEAEKAGPMAIIGMLLTQVVTGKLYYYIVTRMDNGDSTAINLTSGLRTSSFTSHLVPRRFTVCEPETCITLTVERRI